MILIWTGVLVLALKLLAVEPVAALSWWWTLSPFVAALVWFEVLEKPLKMDRRRVEHLEVEKRRKDRVAAQFAGLHPGSRRK